LLVHATQKSADAMPTAPVCLDALSEAAVAADSHNPEVDIAEPAAGAHPFAHWRL